MVLRNSYITDSSSHQFTSPLRAININDGGKGHSAPSCSPPVEKKKLKRVNPLAWVRSASEGDIKTSSPEQSRRKSILRTGIRSISDNDKRVGFMGEVKVHQWDENGQSLATESTGLCAEPKDREAFLHRNMMRIMNGNVDNSNGLTSYLFVTPDAEESEANVSLTFIPDKGQQTVLKLVISVGTRFRPEDLCVKANMSGTKLRVIATKEVDPSRGTKQNFESFNERFTLPVEVDPYSVQARLDSRGNLTIEAPVVNNHKKSQQHISSSQTV